MQLSRHEEKATDGQFGKPLSLAYKILLAIGEALDAKKLVPVKWSHVSGVNYNTIGDAGFEFLSEISKAGTKVAVFTTINPLGYDKSKRPKISEEFKQKQEKIANSYLKMGIVPSFSCIPYEIFNVPRKYTSVSFAESNAAIMANSIYGMVTNKESSLSALASAITGKTPYCDLRDPELRSPRVRVEIDSNLENELDYGILGYYAGKTINKSCISLGCHAKGLDIMKAKSLSAALGTSGSCGMFSSEEPKAEIMHFGKQEAESVMAELDTTERGDIIALGSPQLGMRELTIIAQRATGKKFSKPCMIFCPRTIYRRAFMSGIVQTIENAGGSIHCDACTCLTPLITRTNYDGVITNSIKASYYLNKFNNISVCLRDLRTIMNSYLK